MIILEMVSINTYTTYSCSKKKASPIGSLFSVCIFTAIFSILLFLLYRQMPIWGNFNGKGIFMLVGFLYVIPLKLMFNQTIKQTAIVLSSSWIYTMFSFALSVRIAYLFPLERLAISTLIIQTLFYGLTLPYYMKFVRKIYVYILMNLEKHMLNMLLAISVSWFFVIFILNYILVEGTSIIMELLILIAIIGNAIMSFRMAHHLVYINNKANNLSKIVKIDKLTQLKNREGLYEDALQKMELDHPFTMVFADLNDFKSINDCFGHAAGDDYLKLFAATAKDVLEEGEFFYRLHGDEFVFLVESTDVKDFCEKIHNLQFKSEGNGMTFKGLSLGCADFPEDGNTVSELLYMSDLRMYQVKKEQHKKL